MDIVDSKTRSRMMSNIKNRNTRPEIEVRKRLFAMGYRYRLHVKKLPGCPDMVFPTRNVVVFINGCFWHYHNCHLFKMPKTRTTWWKNKLEGNKKRDKQNITALKKLGWRILVIWECSFKTNLLSEQYDNIALKASAFLDSNTKRMVLGTKDER